jgi:hypothetical protein
MYLVKILRRIRDDTMDLGGMLVDHRLCSRKSDFSARQENRKQRTWKVELYQRLLMKEWRGRSFGLLQRLLR